MKRIHWLIIIPLLLTSISLRGQEEGAIDITGYVRNYTGLLTSNPSEFSIVQNTLNLSLSKRADKTAFKVNPYLYHYFDSEIEIGLREAYLDLYFKNFDLRVGKQQIIWGKADGVFITDIVSPKDLSEFLLPDFDEIRTGITSFKLDYYISNSTVEIVWAPLFTPTRMPEDGSIWKPKMIFPVQPNFDYSTSKISPELENSEIYFRYSMMASSFDFELVGGSFYYDDPAMHITKQIDPVTMQLTGITVRPEYHRVVMGGGSFSMPVGGFVVRGEGAFYSGRFFATASSTIPDAVVEKNNLHYMAGLDYSIGGVKLSAQFIQEYIIDYDADLLPDEFESTMTFLVKKDFFREKMWLELFSYVGLNSEDALIRPKIIWSFADGFDIQGGANIFVGDSGRFGQYDPNDMIYIKMKYSF